MDWERGTIAIEDGGRQLDVVRYRQDAFPRVWCRQPGGQLWALAFSDGSVAVRDAEIGAAR